MEQETEMNVGTAQVVADLTKSLIAHKVVSLSHPTDSVVAPVIVLPNEHGGLRLEAVEHLFEPYRENPKYRKGTAVLNDVASFVAHANRFKNAESALFANNDPSKPGIACVFDYHQRVNTTTRHLIAEDPLAEPDIVEVFNSFALPNWMQHRSSYLFPLDKAWKAWQAGNGQWMGQEAFALFIEERNEDIIPTLPILSDPQNEADRRLAELVEDLNATVANRRTMMGLSVGLNITSSSNIVNVSRINSGTGSIVFEEEHKTQDSEGRKIDVPTMFLLGIPVFENGHPYRVVARLRYRKDGPAIKWKYDLYRADKAFDHAFTDVCREISTATGLPLFVGAPERWELVPGMPRGY
jgi:hypothetical protein